MPAFLHPQRPRLQFTAKGTVDGGFVDSGKLRITLRKRMNEASVALAAAQEAAAEVHDRITATEKRVRAAENAVLKADAGKKRAQGAEAEQVAVLDGLRSEVRPWFCICLCGISGQEAGAGRGGGAGRGARRPAQRGAPLSLPLCFCGIPGAEVRKGEGRRRGGSPGMSVSCLSVCA